MKVVTKSIIQDLIWKSISENTLVLDHLFAGTVVRTIYQNGISQSMKRRDAKRQMKMMNSSNQMNYRNKVKNIIKKTKEELLKT